MNPDDKSLRFKWWSTAKPSTTFQHTPFAEQLKALIELTSEMVDQPTCSRFSGEPTIPSVPWELGPIDELFLKTIGVSRE